MFCCTISAARNQRKQAIAPSMRAKQLSLSGDVNWSHETRHSSPRTADCQSETNFYNASYSSYVEISISFLSSAFYDKQFVAKYFAVR
jgi:hypothetical protein